MSVEGYVWGIYTWLGWSGEVAEPIGSSVPVRVLILKTCNYKVIWLLFDEMSYKRKNAPSVKMLYP